MLKEVFRTVPIPYYKRGEFPVTGFAGVTYHPNIEPYIENMAMLSGIYANTDQCPDGPTSIYVWAMLNVAWWPSWGFGYYRFSGTSGKFIKRAQTHGNLGDVFLSGGVAQSRVGRVFLRHLYGDTIYFINLGESMASLEGDEPETEETWSIAEVIPIDRFKPEIQSFGGGGHYAIDDAEDRYLDASFNDLRVFIWSTGEFKYKLTFPEVIAQLALEDSDRVYILLGATNTLILFDYMRGEVMGAVKLPPLQLPNQEYWNNINIEMAWDPIYRRVLVTEETPNNPDGSSTIVTRGFRLVPEPVRITTPIPLIVPRQGRVVPVLVQVVGDLNEGVGNYAVQAEVYGSGSLVGIPLSNHRGDTLLQVACEGSTLFVHSPPSPSGESPFDWEETGSPESGSPEGSAPHTGLVEINVSVVKYQPDPKDIPVSGGYGPLPGGAPGVPGGDTDPGSDLPDEAPNMMYILENLLASGQYDISGVNSLGPNGRGAMTEAAVTAMHDIDARFGHVDKPDGTGPSPNRYNGHAVDALAFKNDDGVTGEIFDIFIGSEEGALSWRMDSRDAHGLDVWKYPA